jgi:hypothetical protein
MEGYKTCGECSCLLEVDEDGEGYCALKDLYTFRNKDEQACEEFIKEKENNKEGDNK